MEISYLIRGHANGSTDLLVILARSRAQATETHFLPCSQVVVLGGSGPCVWTSRDVSAWLKKRAPCFQRLSPSVVNPWKATNAICMVSKKRNRSKSWAKEGPTSIYGALGKDKELECAGGQTSTGS